MRKIIYTYEPHKFLALVVQHIQRRVKSILDIGCGIAPQRYAEADKYTYVEPFADYLPQLLDTVNQRTGLHQVLNHTWKGALPMIADRSFESIFILDVIEHLEKEDGVELLKQTLSKATKQVVIFTPYGFIEQEHPDGIDAWGYKGGDWQKHRSGWVPDDFEGDWTFIICPNYFGSNNVGIPYDEPKGGFFAIKNIEIPTVSLILPTFKRAELLKHTLTHLLQENITFPLEIVVVNDGVPDDTESVCNSFKGRLNIKYIFSGQRNANGIIKRSPAISSNIGVKNAAGEIIVLSCPEMLHIGNALETMVSPLFLAKNKMVTHPTFIYFDEVGDFTANGGSLEQLQIYWGLEIFPFLLAMYKEAYVEIGGYDEDLWGACWDDNDLIDRLILNGGYYHKTESYAIHLYHGKRFDMSATVRGNPEYDSFFHNFDTYGERKGTIKRNIGKDWGKIDE
jgi:glycosyltransferase involved in cell wall biosynthesis